MRSLDIAATGLAAQQVNIDTISQNLANMTTTGFKSERPEFQDLLYQDVKRVGSNANDQGAIQPVGLEMGLGVKTDAITRDMSSGTMTNTNEPLDMAVQGRGYFQVELADGTLAYTRDGSFTLSPDGVIVTKDGLTVQPAITIPPDATSVNINTSGQVQVTIQGQIDPQQVGQLQMATFVNEGGLQPLGDNMYAETAASSSPTLNNPGIDGTGTILQGYLEASNVNPVTQITNLIVAQRAYEMNTKVLTASDQMMQSLNQSA
ncbi:MAG: flagellar basal-body rod protein FlgG [Alphaproteobacteria bacterium]